MEARSKGLLGILMSRVRLLRQLGFSLEVDMPSFFRIASALNAAAFVVMFTLGLAANLNSVLADEPLPGSLLACPGGTPPDCDGLECPADQVCQTTVSFCYCSV